MKFRSLFIASLMTIPTFLMSSYIPLASNAGTGQTFCNKSSEEVYVAFLGQGTSAPWGGGVSSLYYSKGWFKWIPGECRPVPVLADHSNRTYGFYAISANRGTIWENMSSDAGRSGLKYCIRKDKKFNFGFQRVDGKLASPSNSDYLHKECSSKGGIVVSFLELRSGTTSIE